MLRKLLSFWVFLFVSVVVQTAYADVTEMPELLPGRALSLTEDWHLYQNRLLSPTQAVGRIEESARIQVPHVWPEDFGTGSHGTYGTATYVRHISLPGPAYAHALRPGKMRAVYRLYAVVDEGRGEPVVYDLGGNGTPGDKAEGGAAGRLFHVTMPFDASSFDLVVQVSNHIYAHGGFLWAPKIGPADEMAAGHEGRIAAVFGFSGLLLAFGIVTALLAFWHAGGRYYYIGAGILVVLAARLLLINNYIWILLPVLDLECALRAEYICLFLLIPSYYWLVSNLYPSESNPFAVLAFWVIAAMAILVALLAPIPTMFALRDPYILMSAIGLGLILLVFAKARKNGRDGATWALVGVGIAGLGTALDVYLYIPGPRTSVEAVPFAALAFCFVLLGLFTVRYRKEQQEKAHLAGHLAAANSSLQAHADRLDAAQAEAEAALDMKNSFLSNISREVQTPLRAIQNVAGLLIDQPQRAADPADREEYLRQIKNNSTSLASLMADVLSIADLETGRFEMEPKKTDARNVIDMALSVVEPTADEKHILIDLKCESATLVIDRRLMRQALIKILSNAVKYSPANGVVTARGSLAGGDYVVTIMDTGPGMEASEIPVAMSLFGQADKGEHQNRGLGLGLPLVARFLDLLGGGMQIDSIPGLGTTVTLSFPLTPPKAAANDAD